MFFQMNKSQNFTPGFIMVLHTFGRDLKWNPHIHCLISESGYSNNCFWCHVKHFKMIRYGGIYARHREADKHLRCAISREKHPIFRSFRQWRTAILSYYNIFMVNTPYSQ